MKATPKRKAVRYSTSLKLLLVGTALFVAWPIIIASFSGHLFFCGLIDGKCTDGGSWQDALAIGPTMIGAFILSLAVFYDANFDRALKVLAAVAITAVLTFIGYWLTVMWFFVEMWLRAAFMY